MRLRSSGAEPQLTPLPSSSHIIDMRGLQGLLEHLAQLPAIFSWIDLSGLPVSGTKGQLQRPPAHFPPLEIHFGQKVHLVSVLSTLHFPSMKQVKNTESVQLHPVISFSLSLHLPQGESDERSLLFRAITITHLFVPLEFMSLCVEVMW